MTYPSENTLMATRVRSPSFPEPGALRAALIVGLAYYLGAKLGLALTLRPSPISTLWPPNSILLSALLLTVVGGLCLFYTLTNDLTIQRLKNTKIEHLELAVISATLTVTGLMVLFGFLTVITTPKTHRR